MDLGTILSNYSYFFILIMVRYVGIFLVTPVLGSKVILTRIKIGLAFLLAIVTIPILYQQQSVAIPASTVIIALELVRELAIGLLLGFVLFLVFAAIQLAGQLIDLRMGFRIANVFDPISGASSPVVGQFKNILATLVFLSINGHHLILKSIYKSFAIISLGGANFNNSLWQFVFRRSADMFLIAFKIALPVVGTIFVVDVILGFLARAVPQMNIFIVGLPVKIIVGFIVLFVTVEMVIYFYSGLFQEAFRDVMKVIRLLGS